KTVRKPAQSSQTAMRQRNAHTASPPMATISGFCLPHRRQSPFSSPPLNLATAAPGTDPEHRGRPSTIIANSHEAAQCPHTSATHGDDFRFLPSPAATKRVFGSTYEPGPGRTVCGPAKPCENQHNHRKQPCRSADPKPDGNGDSVSPRMARITGFAFNSGEKARFRIHQ